MNFDQRMFLLMRLNAAMKVQRRIDRMAMGATAIAVGVALAFMMANLP